MRPKKDDSQRLTDGIRFRVTALEKAALERAADQCGMSVSDYCRDVVFGAQPKLRLTPDQQQLLNDVREIRLDLGRITNHWKVREWPQVHSELIQLIKALKPLLNL